MTMKAPDPEASEQPQPEESTPESAGIRRRARLGVVLLGARAVLQQLTILVANVYLARTLTPADYGIFAIVQFAMSLFTLFGDAGLGTALIQKHERPERRELSTIFWFQLGIAIAILTVVYASAPFVLLLWDDLPDGSVWLLRGLALGFLFTMLRAVPMLLLERSLRYGWIATLEFLGTMAFYGTAVVMASRGAGATSLVSASVAQAAALAVAANLVQPFVPALAFDRERLGKLVRFGVAFQGKHAIGFVNHAVVPLFAGARLGKTVLGHIQFAQQIGYFPSLPVGIISRVTFPLLSRLQRDRPAFVAEVERAVLFCGVPTFWFAGLVCGLGPSIVSVIYSDKWMPAVPALYVYALTFAAGFYFTILGSAVDAFGRPQLMLRLTAFATVVNWACVAVVTSVGRSPLVFALGYAVHVAVGNVALLVAFKGLLPEARPLARLWAPALSAVVVGGLARAALPWSASPLRLTACVLGSAIVFAGMVLALDRSLWAALKAGIGRDKAAEAPPEHASANSDDPAVEL